MIQNFLIVSVVSLAVGAFGGWKVNTWKYESERNAEIEAQNEALDKVAEELAKIEVKNVTIKQRVVEHVTEKLVYTECKHDSNGMLLVNEAISGRPVNQGKLPRTNPTNQ